MKDRLQASLQHSDAILAVGVIGLVLLLVIPLPPLILDILLSFNLALSVMALLLTLYVEDVSEFSAFPTLLLFLTLYRLGLNIASTRMILTRAEGGDIIHTFGNFVTDGHVVVGIILFALLTVINFMVVTKGAGRVAEVSARFTLEALSGKQMAIDGEIGSGVLSKEEAKEQRLKVSEEAEFYGAMDGASKFVRGDAVASLIITCVNIVGGLCIGFFVKGFSVGRCWDLYTRLTVGDGLVSQIPALFISIASGIIVTRASKGSLGALLTKQVFNHPKVFLITGLTLLLLSVVPGMPLLILVPLGGALLGYSFYLFKEEKRPELSKSHKTIELQLGVKVAGHAERIRDELGAIRSSVESSLGVAIPAVRISDSSSILPHHYAVLVQGESRFQERVFDVEQLIVRIERVIAKQAHSFLSLHDVEAMIERVRRFDKTLTEQLQLGLLQTLKVLQNLLKEEVSIRDFTTIVEVLAESEEQDVDHLTQLVREALSRKIMRHCFGESKVAHVITLDPKVEKMIQASITFSSQERLRPQTVEKISAKLADLSEKVLKNGSSPVVVTDRSSRLRLRRLIEKRLPDLPVLAFSEMGAEFAVECAGMVETDVLI